MCTLTLLYMLFPLSDMRFCLPGLCGGPLLTLQVSAQAPPFCEICFCNAGLDVPPSFSHSLSATVLITLCLDHLLIYTFASPTKPYVP